MEGFDGSSVQKYHSQHNFPISLLQKKNRRKSQCRWCVQCLKIAADTHDGLLLTESSPDGLSKEEIAIDGIGDGRSALINTFGRFTRLAEKAKA